MLTPEFINRMKKDKSSVLVWLDFMKFGRLSVADLNHTTDLLQRVLSALPEQSWLSDCTATHLRTAKLIER